MLTKVPDERLCHFENPLSYCGTAEFGSNALFRLDVFFLGFHLLSFSGFESINKPEDGSLICL
jgi:hypothetical protein